MKRFILYLLLPAISGMATAQTLSVDDVEVLPGSTASYVLKANVGEGAYTGFQYQMQFPAEGFATTHKTTVLSTWQGATFSVGDLVSGSANASAYSSDGIQIPFGDIIVGSVEFSVDANVELGEYDVTISGFDFLDGTNYIHANGGSDVTFKVIVTDRLTLDENSTTAPTAQAGVNVKVKRTINANEWSTLCLPFNLTAAQVKTAFGDDVELAYFIGYDVEKDGTDVTSITINFEADDLSEDFSANYPYLIKTSQNITAFSFDGVTIAPDNVQETFSSGKGATKKSGKFIGTYKAETVVPEKCLFLNGNKFYYSVGKTKMKAFRAYFDIQEQDVLSSYSEPTNAPVFMSFNNETTGIDVRRNDKGEMTNHQFIYNLNGQRVEKPKKGMYIINNKKVVVK